MGLRCFIGWSRFAALLAAACAYLACSSRVDGDSPDGGHDAAVADGSSAEASLGTPSDAAPDSPVDAGGVVCHPMSVSGYVPRPFIGPSVRSAACSGFDGDGGLVQAYGDSCLGHSATYESCSSFSAPDASGAKGCYACDASSYGVAIAATTPVVNYFGCIQAVDLTEAGTSCARTLEIAAECLDYACRTACPPITDDSSQSAYLSCTDEALGGGCVGYALSAQECLSVEQGDGGTPVAKVCFGGITAEEHYLASARYFCAE
jgi:hypothetical protein